MTGGMAHARPSSRARPLMHAPCCMPCCIPCCPIPCLQGNIAKWLKKEGDEIGPGMLLAEVETDKATIEWEAQEEGYLAKILQPEGAKDIPIGSPVYVLCEDAAAVPAFKDYSPASGGARESWGCLARTLCAVRALPAHHPLLHTRMQVPHPASLPHLPRPLPPPSLRPRLPPRLRPSPQRLPRLPRLLPRSSQSTRCWACPRCPPP